MPLTYCNTPSATAIQLSLSLTQAVITPPDCTRNYPSVGPLTMQHVTWCKSDGHLVAIAHGPFIRQLFCKNFFWIQPGEDTTNTHTFNP